MMICRAVVVKLQLRIIFKNRNICYVFFPKVMYTKDVIGKRHRIKDTKGK